MVRYRRKTVTENLRLTLPGRNEVEIRNIRRKFYRHLCDIFMEMIKSISISRQEMRKRFHCTNPEILVEFEKKEKSMIFLLGHYGSYEWINSLDHITNFESVGIYKPIRNPYFDQLARRIRGRLGSRLIASQDVVREVIKDKRQGKKVAYGLISDQSPKLSNANYWTEFMGITVPVFTGGEQLARKLDLSVIYLRTQKVKRGFYEVELVPITQDAPNQKEYEITNTFLTLLEDQIKAKPEHYFWTHKRWKLRDTPSPKNAVVYSRKK